jgi:hypothetical protein
MPLEIVVRDLHRNGRAKNEETDKQPCRPKEFPQARKEGLDGTDANTTHAPFLINRTHDKKRNNEQDSRKH